MNNNDFTNLTQYTIKTIESEEARIEGSQANTTTYILVDNDGIIKSVEETMITIMNTIENNDEKEDEENINLINEVYNKDNQISLEDIQNNEGDNNSEINNNIKFNITGIYTKNRNIINCTDKISKDKIYQLIYKYFDNFSYSLFNITENEFLNNKDINNNSRILDEDDIEDGDEKEDKGYYGIKTMKIVKEVYSYNLIGLKMKGNVYTEIEPSTGLAKSNLDMIFGNKHSKIKIKDQRTNMHIILKNKNQMAYNLILLLNKTNSDLIERNKIYAEIILYIQKNITDYFTNYYEYYNLFKESLNDLYNQVQNFTGEFFYELIKLINRTYENYTNILNDIIENNYDMINQIRNITKEEYINYIYEMIDILNFFENNTSEFLENIEKELLYVDDFQIDLLYDIIDQIYEAKLIFLEFNKNLFKSIEKGILTFKYDIKDYIDEIIGDLLYITDFLSVNINKNEILSKAIDENSRKDATIKLKNFRNIIITIMDLLIDNINDDYNNEMKYENNKSIKYYSYEKSSHFLSNIEDKSNEVINKIKSKINHMNLYELYSENLDIINRINNKTTFEFIDNMYNNIIYNIKDIKPEYYNEESNIRINRNKLFNISNKIINEINSDIESTNNYIKNYINKYKEENIYNFHYNLYFFRQYFLDKEMKNLLNEFYLLVNKTIKIHFKEIIDYNFALVNEVFDEENKFFTKYQHKKRRLITTGFIKRYEEYKSKFENYLYLTFSDEFFSIIEKYFYKIRDDILNHIKKKLLSLNKYYFDIELYKNNLYFIEQSYNEILHFSNNINNYYNELNLDGDLKIKAFTIAEKELTPYHKKKIKDLDNYYKKIYERTTHYHIRNSDNDFVWSKWRTLKGWKNRYYNTKHKNNINKVIINLKKADEFISKETTKIINNFIKKFDKYLNNYYSLSQKLFNDLYNYFEGKLKSPGNEEELINNYKNIINETINIDSNEGLFERLYKNSNSIGENINYNLNNFKNNINLLKNEYFDLHFKNDNIKFLEYPEEIVYKINQFLNEIIYNSDSIKDNINFIYKSKVANIIKSTNNYIENYINFDYNYILSKINANNIIDKYYYSKYKTINKTFTIFLNNLKSIKDNKINDDNLYLNQDNYNNHINTIISNTSNFIEYLEELINQTFIPEICQVIDNETICIKEKKKLSSEYSKYNYNIVKLRNGIYYTKKLIENWNSLLDNFDYLNIINVDKINKADIILNDKNIIHIYNNTNYKLDQLNKESILLVDEIFEEFIDEFKNKYTFKDDYLPFIQIFIEIIDFKNDAYNKSIIDINNDIIIYVNNLLNEFIDIHENLSLIYQNYSDYYRNIFNKYISVIQKTFQNYKNKILSLNNSYIFYNSIKNILRELQREKREYFKNEINDFSKKYDYEMINMTYNLGFYTELFMEKEYDDYEFSFIYDYVELFLKYNQSYINGIIQKINDLEKNINDSLLNIYSTPINNETLKTIKNNYICFDYYDLFMFLNIKNEKKDFNNEYLQDIINITFFNCFNEFNIDNLTNISLLNNYSLIEKIEYIQNTSQECFNYLYNNNIMEFQESIQLLDCLNHNFYNYTNKLIEEADIIFNKIKDKIESNYIDDIFLDNFLKNYNIQLNPYKEIDLNDISYNFEGIENMINYANYLKDSEFSKFLYEELIYSFNNSYPNFVNNFLVDDLTDEVTALINNKLELYISYMTDKIENEFNYYSLILENTEEMGYSSKMAFINLYENIKDKMNESLYYLIEDDVFFYLDIFYRENKKIFRNNFINYYVYNLNQYKIALHKFSDFYDEILIQREFNKTLDEISKQLLKIKILDNIKKTINNSINNKILKLYDIIDDSKKNIKIILDSKQTKILPDDMTIINELIINYTKIVNNQNNRFKFKVSENSFNIISDFIHTDLEPPLILIRDQYNTIEERLLNELIRIINEFPDFFEVLRNKLKLHMIHKNISSYIEEVNELFSNYSNILIKEYQSYINKLIHYTYINGLYSYDNPCNYSFCFINLENE